MRIVAGTANPEKIIALRQMLEPVAGVIAPPIPGKPRVNEAGRSIAEIAERKATGWSRWLSAHDVRLPVIVTDGGLTIPALAERWDPTRTRRFAGEGLSPLQLARTLLERTSALQGEDRQIGWTEVAVIVDSDGRSSTFSAESPPGILATSVRSEDLTTADGFWIPAIWLCPEYGMKRLIDLTQEERSRRPDHWDRLGAKLRDEIDRLVSVAQIDQSQT